MKNRENFNKKNNRVMKAIASRGLEASSRKEMERSLRNRERKRRKVRMKVLTASTKA